MIVAPFMVAIAVLIRLTSRGPVIYTQTRVGIDRRTSRAPRNGTDNCRRRANSGGRQFTMYKFRTMRPSNGNGDGDAQVWTSPSDPRVTAVGRVLRRYRLDELPQLVNVLRGDMNVVGPRPEQPEIFARLRNSVDRYHTRQQVLPGITGLAQVSHRYDQSIDDVRIKVDHDLKYIARKSPWEDLRILARTIPTVVLKRGAW